MYTPKGLQHEGNSLQNTKPEGSSKGYSLPMITHDFLPTPWLKLLHQAYQTHPTIVTATVSILVTLVIGHFASDTCNLSGLPKPVRCSENRGLWAHLIIFVISLPVSASLNATILAWMHLRLPVSQDTPDSPAYDVNRTTQEIIAVFKDMGELEFVWVDEGFQCKIMCGKRLGAVYLYLPFENMCMVYTNGGPNSIEDTTREIRVGNVCMILNGTVAEKGAEFFRYWIIERKGVPPSRAASA